jgi:hypothetical protein
VERHVITFRKQLINLLYQPAWTILVKLGETDMTPLIILKKLKVLLQGNILALSTTKIYLCVHPLPVPMAARITNYLNIYVCRCLCLIYMFSFYFWSLSLARKMRKTNMRYYPEYPSRSWHPILVP